MSVVEFQVRPIDQWPRPLTRNRKRAPFRADYGTTMQLLDRELRMIRAKGIVLLMAYREQDIRLDGRPRANARPDHPGVIVAFEDKTGPKRFPCDAFDHWCANLRAIGLALEALRKVDRYGVTTHGEQYRGWQALPNPDATFQTLRQAAEFIGKVIGSPLTVDDRRIIESAIAAAERKTHPDAGGNASDFHKVQQARKLLLN